MILSVFFVFVVFVFGLCVGSFLNVLIYRLPRGLGFVKGRSFCPHCKRKINWFDNVPLISFVLLKGRCRFCHSPISWRYPVVELMTGLITLLILNFKFQIFNQFLNLNFQIVFDLVCYLILAWALIVIFFIDLEHQIIPDEVVYPIVALFLLKSVLFSFNTGYLILNTFLSAIGASLFLLLIYLVTKGKGMGFGDVKLAFLMGLVLGFPKIVVAFYLAFLTGAFVGIILILGKYAKFGQKIAFGPFLALSTIISVLWGEKILSLALKVLL